MSNELETYIDKYILYKTNHQEIQGKLDKYRKNIKKELKKLGIKSYNYNSKNAKITITLQNATKETVNRQTLPEHLWKQYAKKTEYEVLQVKNKAS